MCAADGEGKIANLSHCMQLDGETKFALNCILNQVQSGLRVMRHDFYPGFSLPQK